ncbi:hypothetical protein [Streptomyces benahoarensis]|uniref:Leucine-binding protein domain-containing protein n=1 Tax=Streptomyces benahoarensis TaxID=2595054 RepID=A0A553ZLH6_9ACTN|nr:hypothetical protein [Streptomyces benahoarensis]TSB22505.1 hypothetical protein FNJ62_16260 [Streptomyces benahoarensis]TSB42253.1 hypothetical protein FNZ23_10880 [Streptomyces benahoarensis]
MSARSGEGRRAASPLLSAAEVTAQLGDVPPPAGHTDAELAAVLGLLTDPTGAGRRRSRIEAVVVGHSRDAASAAAARAFAGAWRAAGRPVWATVDWPEEAASWLRFAGRLTAPEPDAWVIAAAAPGWAQMSRRLRHSTGWDPARTVGFAALGDSRLAALAGPGTLDGMRGATADGHTWVIDRGWVTRSLPGPPA